MPDDAVGFSGLIKLASEYRPDLSRVKNLDESNHIKAQTNPETPPVPSAAGTDEVSDQSGAVTTAAGTEKLQDNLTPEVMSAPYRAAEESVSIPSAQDKFEPKVTSSTSIPSIDERQKKETSRCNEELIETAQQPVQDSSGLEERPGTKEPSAPTLSSEEHRQVDSSKDLVKSPNHVGKGIRPTPKGIGGLLYVFCFFLVVMSPFAFLAGTGYLLMMFLSPGYCEQLSISHLLISRIQIALSLFVISSVFSGYIVYFGSKHGRKVAILYLVVSLGVGIWPLTDSSDIVSLDFFVLIGQSFPVYIAILLGWTAFWLVYFIFSQRTRNNYCRDYSMPIREAPLTTSTYIILPIWVVLVLLLQIPSLVNIFTFQHAIPLQTWQIRVQEFAPSIVGEAQNGISPMDVASQTTSESMIQVHRDPQDSNENLMVADTVDLNSGQVEPESIFPPPNRTYTVSIGKTNFVVPEPSNSTLQSGATSENKHYRIKIGFLQRDDAQSYLIAYAFTSVSDVEERLVDEKSFASYRDWLAERYRQLPRPVEILENGNRTITFSFLSDATLNQQPAKRRTTESFAILKGKLYRLLVNVIYKHGAGPFDGFEALLIWRTSIIRANLEGRASKNSSAVIPPLSLPFSRALERSMHIPQQTSNQLLLSASRAGYRQGRANGNGCKKALRAIRTLFQ